MGCGTSKVGNDSSLSQNQLVSKIDVEKDFQENTFCYNPTHKSSVSSESLEVIMLSDNLCHQMVKSSICDGFLQKKKMLVPTSDFYRLADERALNVPIIFCKTKEQLINYLIEPFIESMILQLRVVWRWVTDNINDIAGSVSGPCFENKQLSRFAALLTEYTEGLGLKIKSVSGWVKFDNTVVPSINNDVYHVWNAVYLDHTWWLMDVAWASGYLNDKMEFIKNYNDHYFFTDPEEFIYDHYPQDCAWQLLNEPISRQTFKSLPFYARKFFDFQMKSLTHLHGIINCDESAKLHLKFKIATNKFIDCFGILYDMENNKDINRGIRVYITEKLLHLFVTVPYQGKFILKLFTKTSKNQNSSTCFLLCAYIIICNQYFKSVFPKQFKQFHPGYCLYSPLQGELIIGKNYKFKIALPGAIEMVVCLGGTNASCIPIALNKDCTWEGDVFITDGSERLTVVAKFPQKRETFSSVLEYQVIF